MGCHALRHGIFQTQGLNPFLTSSARADKFFATSASWIKSGSPKTADAIRFFIHFLWFCLKSVLLLWKGETPHFIPYPHPTSLSQCIFKPYLHLAGCMPSPHHALVEDQHHFWGVFMPLKGVAAPTFETTSTEPEGWGKQAKKHNRKPF